jgi:hypothetical protein
MIKYKAFHAVYFLQKTDFKFDNLLVFYAVKCLYFV